jgi:soluble lytic murein transglycosylase
MKSSIVCIPAIIAGFSVVLPSSAWSKSVVNDEVIPASVRATGQVRLASASGSSASGAASAAVPSSAADELLLTAVANGRVAGLQFLDFAARTQLRIQAGKYVLFRKKKISAAERQKWLEECRNPATRNVFCREQDFAEAGAAPETDIRGKARPKVRAGKDEAERAYAAMMAGETEELLSSSESAINQALRRVSQPGALSKAAQSVVKRSPCDAVPLNTMMAQKVEEFLPADDARAMVLQLHEHAASCTTDSEWSNRSKYRLSLLLIAQGDWARAEKWLGQLSQDRTNDYFSRSLYWRARAARNRGDLLAFEQAKARLTREFPIHYHSLLLGGKKAFNSAQNLHLPEPVVHLESAALGAKWNDRIRALETLQEQGATEYTRSLFEQLEEMMDKAEPEARLYLAVLQNRNFNAIGTFRTLSSLMRDHPSVLSRQTLSLFFPLTKEHRHILYTFAGGGLDPYILAALIRQESGFVTSARSPAGALGLMQLMPTTARTLDRVSKRELLDGRTNVRLGVKFFKQLVNRFGGKVDHALAAYNAGPERVDDWKRRYQVEDPVLFVDLIPFRETREYVSLISRNYYWYLQIYARHIFDERFEAARAMSKNDRRGAIASAVRAPANQNFPLEFSLFSAH